MNVKFACCYFSSYYSASDIVFFSVVFVIFQFFRPVNYESFQCLKRQEFEQRLVVLYSNTLFQWIEQDLLRKFTLVLELNLNFRWEPFKDLTEVQLRRSDCDSIRCNLELQVKCDGKCLLFDIHLERYFEEHWLDSILIKKWWQVFISCELDPDIKRRLLLDVAYHWIELKIFLGFWRLNHFKTNWAFTSIVKSYLFPINMP